MKRWIGSLALALVAGAAMGQAPFTIVRPVDGARVRETVRILIPKGSIPENGYVGIFIDGKFIEAIRPPVVGKYFEYDLDTKARQIADSEPGKPYKLEVVLFTEYNDTPRIVERSSVDVYVANHSSITVPNAGLSLRYKWTTGTEHIYRITEKVHREAIAESQQKLGGIAAELENDVPLNFRILYAVDRKFSDGDGLIRIQPLPEKGKDYVIIPVGEAAPTKHYDVELAPIYMRLSDTGHQVWGTIPVISPGDVLGGRSVENDLFADFPLPSLPVRSVRPQDSWKSRFQEGALNLAKITTNNTLVETYAARGEFTGVEWEMGHPCAVIKNTISESESSSEAKALEKQNPGVRPTKVKVEETIWFSLDTRLMLRMERQVELETTGTNSAYGFASSGGSTQGGGFGTPGGAPMGPGMPGGPGGAGGRPRGPAGFGGGAGAGGGKNDDFHPPMTINQKGRFGPGPGGAPPGFPGMPGGPGGFPGAGGMGSNGQPEQNAIERIVITETRVLEK